MPGVVLEHKGLSASVHYRTAPDPDAARSAIVRALGDVEDHGLRIGHGRMIVELRPVGLGDKGSAARAIVERFGLRGVVVMGDDVTDLDMFRAVDELRARAASVGRSSASAARPGEVLPALVAGLPTWSSPTRRRPPRCSPRSAGERRQILELAPQPPADVLALHARGAACAAGAGARRAAWPGPSASASAVPTTSAGATARAPSAIWSNAPAVSDRTSTASRSRDDDRLLGDEVHAVDERVDEHDVGDREAGQRLGVVVLVEQLHRAPAGPCRSGR